MNNDTDMEAIILALETEVPQNFLLQEDFTSATARILNLSESKTKLLKRITSGSKIQKRHTAVTDFLAAGAEERFLYKNDTQSPTTGKRNQVYKEEAPKLAEAACQKSLQQWGGDRKEITHIISVSCTGMIAPGIEFLLIDRLGLSANVDRLGINFMGCFGAFKGLSIAKALAQQSAQNRVLVVCTELCSLHFQQDLNVDTMVANSIFADGAAAAIVGVKLRQGEKELFKIEHHASTTLNGTKDLMTWEASDHGFQMRLSASVPAHLENHISPFIQRLIGPKLSFDQCSWAVHPGGKAILNAIIRACHLEEEQLSASWKVLNDYGNMSSPTFLFVLKEVLKIASPKKRVIGLGFGPGLSIEGLLLKQADNYVAE